MNFLDNGRVVVVDDQLKEAFPLIKILSQYGTSTHYFDGEVEGLPCKPLESVRVIFLDIELGTAGQDAKSKVAKVISVLRRIIGDRCYPYAIVAWTKHVELIELIKKGLSDKNPPAIMLNMEKTDCLGEDGELNIETIKSHLHSEFEKLGAFDILVKWENLVHQAAAESVDSSFNYFPFDGDWDEKIKRVLSYLAIAYSGKQGDENVIKSSLLSYNGLLLDFLEENINESIDIFPELELFDPSKVQIEPSLKGTINSYLLVSKEIEAKIKPGNLYLDEGDCKLPNEQGIELKHVFLEVSPNCDYSQKKMKLSRILPGVLCPVGNIKDYKREIHSDSYICGPIININDQAIIPIFDMALSDSLSLEDLLDKIPLCRFRHQFLVDIQAKLSAHISRPGYMAVR